MAELNTAQKTLLKTKGMFAFFKGFSNQDILCVTKSVSFVKYDKYEIIFEQGSEGKEVHIVIQGEVNIAYGKKREDGTLEYKTLANLPVNTVFGEMSMITGEKRTARAMANITDTMILKFLIREEDDEVAVLLKRLFKNFLNILADKLLKANETIFQLSQTSDTEKLAPLLLPFADKVWKAKEKEGVFVITGQLKNRIDHITNKICGKASDRDETLKKSLRMALDLDERDVVMSMADKIIVKKFKSPKQKAIQKIKGVIHIENDSKLQKRIEQMVESKMLMELDIKRIDAQRFIAEAKQVFLTGLENIVKSYAQPDEKEMIPATAKRMLGQQFDFICSVFADNLMQMLLVRDKKAEEFLRYYSGEIDVYAGNIKAKRPELIDSHGNKWSVTTIIPVLMQYKKEQEAIEKKESLLLGFERKHTQLEYQKKEIESQIIDLQGERDASARQLEEADNNVEELRKQLSESRNLVKKLSNDEAVELKAKIEETSLELKKSIRFSDAQVKTTQAITLRLERKQNEKFIIVKEINQIAKKIQEESPLILKMKEKQEPVLNKYNLIKSAIAINVHLSPQRLT